jgi:fatty acid desaturase
MIWRSLTRRDLQLFALALDLCVPPASLLLMLASLCALCGALGWAVSGRLLPWALSAPLPVLLAAALGLAWHKAGRGILPARRLGHALLHTLAKFPSYQRFLLRRRSSDRPGAR